MQEPALKSETDLPAVRVINSASVSLWPDLANARRAVCLEGWYFELRESVPVDQNRTLVFQDRILREWIGKQPLQLTQDRSVPLI